MKILGRRVHIIWNADEDDCGSYSEFPAPTIKISKAFSKESQARTLLHEAHHAAYSMSYGPDDTISEEGAARLFESLASDLMINEPSLSEWIGRSLRGETWDMERSQK